VDKDGHAIPAETPPFAEVDEFAGEPATSGLLRASEVGPPKTKVDVLLAGAIVFPKPVTEVDVELAVGTRLRKRARVFGDRVWLPGMLGTFAAVCEDLRRKAYATASALKSWRNWRFGKAGLLTDALVAGHGPVRCETLFPRLAPGRCQLRRQVYRRDEVHFVRV